MNVWLDIVSVACAALIVLSLVEWREIRACHEMLKFYGEQAAASKRERLQLLERNLELSEAQGELRGQLDEALTERRKLELQLKEATEARSRSRRKKTEPAPMLGQE